VLNFIKMINVISIFLCVCKFILVVAQSGTDHCQLATGQNAHSRNVLFFSRTFSDLISVGGFRNEKKRQIKSDVSVSLLSTSPATNNLQSNHSLALPAHTSPHSSGFSDPGNGTRLINMTCIRSGLILTSAVPSPEF